MKWAIELNEHDIKIEPRNAIKSQVVADFIAEFTHKEMSEQAKEQLDGNDLEIGEQWRLYVDGASNSNGLAAGVVFITLEGAVIERAMTLGFNESNNEAEYEALLFGLRMDRDLGITRPKNLL